MLHTKLQSLKGKDQINRIVKFVGFEVRLCVWILVPLFTNSMTLGKFLNLDKP